MFRLFKHYGPYEGLVVALVSLERLLRAAEMAWVGRAGQTGMEVETVAVLKGKPSAIGSRPQRLGFVVGRSRPSLSYAEGHVVKPGIVGWAQVSYPYGTVFDASWQTPEYDLYYAKNYPHFLDVVRFFQTLSLVLVADGAR